MVFIMFLRREGWWLTGTSLALLGFVFCGYHFYSSWKTLNVSVLPIPDCDLRKTACVSSLDSGERIELRIRSTHIPVVTPLQLEVKTEKITVKKIFIYFKGAEMDMGEFHLPLSERKEGVYHAQTILPTCLENEMVWHAVVYIETPNRRYSAPFVFVNERPRAHRVQGESPWTQKS